MKTLQLEISGVYKNQLGDTVTIESIDTTRRLYRFVDEQGNHYNAVGRQQNKKTRLNDLKDGMAFGEPQGHPSATVLASRLAKSTPILTTPLSPDVIRSGLPLREGLAFLKKSLDQTADIGVIGGFVSHEDTASILNNFFSRNQPPVRRRVTVGVLGAVCVILSTVAIFQTRKTRSKRVTRYLAVIRDMKRARG